MQQQAFKLFADYFQFYLWDEGISPDERILLVKAHEVNWTPWSAWTIPPGSGRRLRMAMSRVLKTRVELPGSCPPR